MRDQRAKIDFGAAQAFLGITQRGVEPAYEPGYEHKQREMYDGPAVVPNSMRPGEREIRADGQGKRGRNQARLPAAVPGADHDGDREHDQAAFAYVGKQEGWNQGKNDAEDGDAVSEDWGPSRSNAAVAK